MNFENLQSIKNMVERSLPPDVVEAMRHAGMQLTLGSSEHIPPPSSFQPVVIDQKLSGPTLREMVPPIGDDIEFEPPRLSDDIFRPADLP